MDLLSPATVFDPSVVTQSGRAIEFNLRLTTSCQHTQSSPSGLKVHLLVSVLVPQKQSVWPPCTLVTESHPVDLPRCPGGSVFTYRSGHQRWNSSSLHSGDDGGDEDEDGPDGVMKELLKQQKRLSWVTDQTSWWDPQEIMNHSTTGPGLIQSGLMWVCLKASQILEDDWAEQASLSDKTAAPTVIKWNSPNYKLKHRF